MIKTKAEIEKIREGGKLLGKILKQTADLVRPGISTWQLNEFAEAEIKKIGGKPSFKGYGDADNSYPTGLCTSINSEVVHGIPSKEKILKEGDIVGLDIGMEYKGLYTDTALTVAVGTVDSKTKKLLDVTKKSLSTAIAVAKAGNRIGDIGHAIQSTAEKAGFSVIRDLVGHGVGYAVHEDPSVPCYGKPGTGLLLKEGMVLAIEPMVSQGDYKLDFDPDGWTVRTKDKSLVAHFEHTICVGKDGAEILTK